MKIEWKNSKNSCNFAICHNFNESLIQFYHIKDTPVNLFFLITGNILTSLYKTSYYFEY